MEAFLTTLGAHGQEGGVTTGPVGCLITLSLSGEPQYAYYDLHAAYAKDYGKLKEEILALLGVTAAVWAQ